MKQGKQGYITLGVNGSFSGDADSKAAQEKVEKSSDVAYRLSTVVEETRDASVSPNAVDAVDMSTYTEVSPSEVRAATKRHTSEAVSLGPVALVMARGKTAKRIIPSVAEAGFCACAVYTQDKRSESYIKLAPVSVSLGEKYSDALFCNAFAVLEAAKNCGASAILLCDEAAGLAQVDSFLARAAARGLRVLRPVSEEAPLLGWVECSTQKIMDDDTWRVCHSCGLTFDEASLASSHYVCPACKTYLRMSSDERINDLLDAGTFKEWNRSVAESDPLSFPGYTQKLESLREKTGLEEAVRTGEGTIAGLRVALGIMESKFLMGSMGSAVGEKVARLVERATAEGLPVVVFTASGGARMQEGLISLMQMAKVSCALERHSQAGLPYISVLTDPTTGGVTASFAMQGDIILAEPRALIGFAGQRVIKDTIKQELPEGFQTAEFALEHGLIDGIVAREDMRSTLAHLLAIHISTLQKGLGRGKSEGEECEILINYQAVCNSLEHGKGTYNTVTYEEFSFDDLLDTEGRVRGMSLLRSRVASLASTLDRRGASSRKRLQRAIQKGSFDAEGGLLDTEEKKKARSSASVSRDYVGDAWESVQLARNVHRPTALTYINAFVEGFIELHGDRAFGDDGAIVCGLGWIDGRAVTVIAQEKGANLKERIRRNFGCPQPEGYRKSLRFMRQAEKFGRPIVCLVDTQGAFCGMEAEERGQGNAIADNLIEMAGLQVPVVSVLLGEGGSGGALALAVSDRVAMQENAVYSVLSPEGFASILWKDRTRAAEAADVMKMGAHEVCAMGVVDDVISEGEGPAHENPDQAAQEVYGYLTKTLDELCELESEALLKARYDRFMKF